MSSAPSAAEQDGINGRQSLSRRSRTEEEVEIKSSGGERGGGGHQPYRSSSSDSSAEHVPGPTIHNDGQFIAIERIRTEQDEPTREGPRVQSKSRRRGHKGREDTRGGTTTESQVIATHTYKPACSWTCTSDISYDNDTPKALRAES